MADQNPNISRDQQERLNLPEDQMVQLSLEIIKPGEDEHRIRERRYNKSYDVYRASEKRPRSLEPWQSKLRVPYGMQVIDTALVNIVSGKPRVMVKPRHPDVEMNAKAMQVLMDYYLAEDHLVEKQPLFVQQGLIYGVTVAKNHWVYQTGNKTRRDMSGPLQGLMSEEVVLRDGPTFEPWSVYDAWWDSARDVDTARYVVLRSWLSKEQLRSQACTVNDHTTNDCNGIYHNVEKLITQGPQSSNRTVTAQQAYLGSKAAVETKTKGLFEILEIWTDDTVTTIGSRQTMLRNDPNPFWHGKKPVVITQTRPDLFEMQGIPETELIDHLQQGMWTLQNMTIDNIHLTTMKGITYREGGVTDPNALQLKPRFKWPVVDHDDIKPFEMTPIPSDVFQERQRLLADMQLVTGINPYVSGSDLSSVDQNTATGVTALQEVASRLLRFKAGQIQWKGYQRSFEMWGDMIQQFLDHDVAVQITGQDGNNLWVNLGPKEVDGHFRYVLEGSEESLSRQQERGEAIALLNAFSPLASLGIVNYKPILERVAVAYDFSNPESLFLPPQPQPPAAPTQQQPQGVDPAQQYYQQQQGQGNLSIDPQLAQALSQIR